MGSIRLREANSGDAARLGALHVASWRETYAGLLPDALLAGLSAETQAAMWGGVLSEAHPAGGTALFVAEEDGAAIGFGACVAQRDRALAGAGFGGEIGALYVLRSHQGRGVGRALMAAMAGAMAGFGHGAASLWVLEANAPARRFYEGLGGEIVGERTEAQAGVELIELAYGWRDLSRLLA